jgi:hypothetical protein
MSLNAVNDLCAIHKAGRGNFHSQNRSPSDATAGIIDK